MISTPALRRHTYLGDLAFPVADFHPIGLQEPHEFLGTVG